MHLACPDCDQLHQVECSPMEGSLLCCRCGSELQHCGRKGFPDRCLALALAALICFVFANAFPLLSLSMQGNVQTATLPSCIRILASMGWPWLAAILLTTVELVPLIYLLGLSTVLIQVRLGKANRFTARLFRLYLELQTWGMVEVFLLGVLISYVKLSGMAQVIPGPSLYMLTLSVFLTAATQANLDAQATWEAILPTPRYPHATLRPGAFQHCHACGWLSPLGQHHCPRCQGHLHPRKLESQGRPWALLVTALILYFPANLLPAMRVTSLGREQADTIMGGILYFLRSGSWPLALVIFLASIVVPILKLGILAFLLISVCRRSSWNPRLRTQLYRLTELIGRWSMVDIFVVILMVAVVEMGAMASVEPGKGAMAFALVVASTMLASRSFDPRLIWDPLEPCHE